MSRKDRWQKVYPDSTFCPECWRVGGDLEIVARFPDGNVRINQFEELDEAVKA
jgi:hypothetical protein